MRNVDAVALAGYDQWDDLSQLLTRGLLHALNNRIAAIRCGIDLSIMGDEDYTPDKFLPKELEQLQAIRHHLQLLVLDDDAPEALELEPLAQLAVALHAHHPRMHATRCVVEKAGEIPPVRLPRPAFLRLLVLLIDDTTVRLGPASPELVPLKISSEESTVAIRFPTPRVPTPYAAAIAAECGARLDRDNDTLVLRVPTLLALRLKEHASGGNAVIR